MFYSALCPLFSMPGFPNGWLAGHLVSYCLVVVSVFRVSLLFFLTFGFGNNAQRGFLFCSGIWL